MKVLLDTHVLVWWLEDADRLSKRSAAILGNRDNGILVSAVVGWEIAIKVGAGKMKPRSILERLEMAVRAGLLPLHHRDPFDRLLVAQSAGAGCSDSECRCGA